ncbi:MAG: SDR family NAD(P)-dependent oxidoreductase [Candidatus Absconditabacterales bacterium]
MIKGGKGVVVITGGSSGIGAGFAREFAEQGYDLLLVAKDKNQMTTFVKYLKVLFPVRITTMLLDLSKKNELKQLEAEIAKISDLEILINCAGYGINKDFLAENIEKREDMVTVHDVAAMRLSYQALKIMKRRKHGNIIHVSSLASLLALGNNPVYAASKIFLNSFSQNLYRICKEYGVYVQSLCPGFTATNFAKRGGYKFKAKTMKVEQVIKSSLLYMKRKKLLCVPGRRNKLILMVYHILPRSRSHIIFNHMRH